MNLSYFPDDITIDRDNLIHLLSNQSFVQFLHRSLAYLIIILAVILGIKMFKEKQNDYLKTIFLYYLFY